MPRRCLHGSTQIMLPDGSTKLLKDLKVGDEILSFDGSSWVPDRIVGHWRTKLKQCYKISAPNQIPLRASHDHRVATLNDSQLTWVPVSKLVSSPLLLTFAGMTTQGIHDPLLAELLAYSIFSSSDNALIMEHVDHLVSIVFGSFHDDAKIQNLRDVVGGYFSMLGFCTEDADRERFIKENTHVLVSALHQFDNSSLESFFGAVLFTVKDEFIKKSEYPLTFIGIPIPRHTGLIWTVYWLLRRIGLSPDEPDTDACMVSITDLFSLYKLATFCDFIGKLPPLNFSTLPIRWNNLTSIPVQITQERRSHLYDIETENHHNFVANGFLVHNSGKDITAWNIAIRQCLRKPCQVYYCLPTFSQARRVIFDALDSNGRRFIDYIPSEVVESINSQEMKVRFRNGSLLQLIGSDTYDRSLVGTNPYGIVFSEYALADPRAYLFARPILSAHDGWCLMITTPRGKNHLWELYNIAQYSPDWFSYKLTIDDTQHIPMRELDRERSEGLMSEDLIQQEYYTSFTMGVQGSYYAKYIDKMRLSGQISTVPWEPSFKVNTAWDLGVRDSTSIIFFQQIGQVIRIIDFYENSKQGLEHYTQMLFSKPYQYGHHVAPHDIAVKEFGSGLTRLEKAQQLGIEFIVASNISIADGIECVRSTLPKVWIDDKNCVQLIKALENYRQEYDVKKQVYKQYPLHNQFSHAADSMRYLCVALPKTSDGLSPEDLDRRYREAYYGDRLPSLFDDQFKIY